MAIKGSNFYWGKRRKLLLLCFPCLLLLIIASLYNSEISNTYSLSNAINEHFLLFPFPSEPPADTRCLDEGIINHKHLYSFLKYAVAAACYFGTVANFNEIINVKLNFKKGKYSSNSSSNFKEFVPFVLAFPGSGNFEELEVNMPGWNKDNAVTVEQLNASGWFDPSVTLVTVSLNLFNPVVNCAIAYKLSFQLGKAGTLATRSHFSAGFFDNYPAKVSSSAILVLASLILSTIECCYTLLPRIRENHSTVSQRALILSEEVFGVVAPAFSALCGSLWVAEAVFIRGMQPLGSRESGANQSWEIPRTLTTIQGIEPVATSLALLLLLARTLQLFLSENEFATPFKLIKSAFATSLPAALILLATWSIWSFTNYILGGVSSQNYVTVNGAIYHTLVVILGTEVNLTGFSMSFLYVISMIIVRFILFPLIGALVVFACYKELTNSPRITAGKMLEKLPSISRSIRASFRKRARLVKPEWDESSQRILDPTYDEAKLDTAGYANQGQGGTSAPKDTILKAFMALIVLLLALAFTAISSLSILAIGTNFESQNNLVAKATSSYRSARLAYNGTTSLSSKRTSCNSAGQSYHGPQPTMVESSTGLMKISDVQGIYDWIENMLLSEILSPWHELSSHSMPLTNPGAILRLERAKVVCATTDFGAAFAPNRRSPKPGPQDLETEPYGSGDAEFTRNLTQKYYPQYLYLDYEQDGYNSSYSQTSTARLTAVKQLTKLREGGFLDSQLWVIRIYWALYNGDSGYATLNEVTFKLHSSGRLAKQLEATPIRSRPRSSSYSANFALLYVSAVLSVFNLLISVCRKRLSTGCFILRLLDILLLASCCALLLTYFKLTNSKFDPTWESTEYPEKDHPIPSSVTGPVQPWVTGIADSSGAISSVAPSAARADRIIDEMIELRWSWNIARTTAVIATSIAVVRIFTIGEYWAPFSTGSFNQIFSTTKWLLIWMCIAFLLILFVISLWGFLVVGAYNTLYSTLAKAVGSTVLIAATSQTLDHIATQAEAYVIYNDLWAQLYFSAASIFISVFTLFIFIGIIYYAVAMERTEQSQGLSDVELEDLTPSDEADAPLLTSDVMNMHWKLFIQLLAKEALRDGYEAGVAFPQKVSVSDILTNALHETKLVLAPEWTELSKNILDVQRRLVEVQFIRIKRLVILDELQAIEKPLHKASLSLKKRVGYSELLEKYARSLNSDIELATDRIAILSVSTTKHRGIETYLNSRRRSIDEVAAVQGSFVRYHSKELDEEFQPKRRTVRLSTAASKKKIQSRVLASKDPSTRRVSITIPYRESDDYSRLYQTPIDEAATVEDWAEIRRESLPRKMESMVVEDSEGGMTALHATLPLQEANISPIQISKYKAAMGTLPFDDGTTLPLMNLTPGDTTSTIIANDGSIQLKRYLDVFDEEPNVGGKVKTMLAPSLTALQEESTSEKAPTDATGSPGAGAPHFKRDGGGVFGCDFIDYEA